MTALLLLLPRARAHILLLLLDKTLQLPMLLPPQLEWDVSEAKNEAKKQCP